MKRGILVLVEMVLEQDIGEWSKKINGLNKSLSSGDWAELERTVFVNALGQKISEMEQIEQVLERIQEEIEKEPSINAPDCAEVKSEFSKTIGLLRRNLELEQGKKSRAKEINALEKDTNPELYASLQQKILELILKSRYLNERLAIFSRKQSAPVLPEKSTGKQLMELLEQKEEEVQELKGKYEGVRRKAYLGLIEEKTASDLESDVSGLDRTLAKHYPLFEQSIVDSVRQMEAIQGSLLAAREKFSEIKEVIEDYSEKNSEFAKILKKERDYAKRVVLDRENETMQLRNSYTEEMLNLQSAKLSAKKEAEAVLGKTIKALRKDLEEKNDSLARFKGIAEEKMKKESELEEKIKDLNLLLRAKQKHDSVKGHFKKKGKKK